MYHLYCRLSLTDTSAFVQTRKISSDSLAKVTIAKNTITDTPRTPTITEENNADNPISEAITDALSQETSDVPPALNNAPPVLNNAPPVLNNKPIVQMPNNNGTSDDVSNQCDELVDGVSQTLAKAVAAVHKSTGYTLSVTKKSNEQDNDSKRKSSCSGMSDVSDSKASTSAVHVSVLDKAASSSLDAACDNAGPDSLDENVSLLESKTLQNNSANHVKHSVLHNIKSGKNNDTYFHEIESYFKEENELPFRATTPKSHKTKDSLKIKRSQNIQGGCTANAYHKDKTDSKSSFSVHSDNTTNLTSVECTGNRSNMENIRKHTHLSKKGSRHKVYDRPVEVAEYNSVGNFMMQTKTKIRERALSDIPSSRLCTPDLESVKSESQESVFDQGNQRDDQGNQGDVDIINLKLPQTESLL